MKTPAYTKRAQLAFRTRKIKEGYKYFSILTTADIVEQLKELYRKLKS